MNTSNNNLTSFTKPYLLFQLFKYLVYGLLSYNIYLFFLEDYAASAHTFTNGIAWTQVIDAFSATVDTTAWVVLLLLFELETFILDDEKIKGWTKFFLHGVRALCYLLIFSALLGYIEKLDLLYTTSIFKVDDLCSIAGQGFSHVLTIDEYMPIEANNCAQLSSDTWLRIGETQILADPVSMVEAQRLSWVEVINSIDWMLVVIILEVDVYLQLKGQLSPRVQSISKSIKAVLYSVLFLAAVYWGIKGDFLDFWDAFLWLVAFIFIELNIFEWHEETSKSEGSTEPG